MLKFLRTLPPRGGSRFDRRPTSRSRPVSGTLLELLAHIRSPPLARSTTVNESSHLHSSASRARTFSSRHSPLRTRARLYTKGHEHTRTYGQLCSPVRRDSGAHANVEKPLSLSLSLRSVDSVDWQGASFSPSLSAR